LTTTVLDRQTDRQTDRHKQTYCVRIQDLIYCCEFFSFIFRHKLFLEGPSHVPALVVFHNLYTELDPKWHIVHLGNPPEKVPPYDSDFLHSEACLLHWDGSRKPWLYPSQTGADIWRKYAVYDLVQPSI
jgi:hypothetical protein